MFGIQAESSGPWYYYGLVVILFGVPVALDALLRWPSSYKSAGYHKWKWVLAALISNLLLIGPVFGLVYIITARHGIRAAKPHKPPAGYGGARDGDGTGGREPRRIRNSASSGPVSWTPAPAQPKRVPVTCYACRGTGQNDDGTVHYSCGGSGPVIGT